MALRYRAVGAVEEPELLADSNGLYWMFDSLAGVKGAHVVFEAVDEPERFVQILALGDGRFDVEWRASNSGDLHSAPGADLLIAHQLVFQCLRDADGWGSVRDQVAGRFGFIEPAADVQVDYASTGLSISNAMQDHMHRIKRLGVPVVPPAAIAWGGLLVSTGDVWRGLRGDLTIVVEVTSMRAGAPQGISISSPQAVLSADGVESQSEVIVWPTEADRRFEVRVAASGGDVRITTVYEVGGKSWSRIERWTEESGFWVELVSADRRVYRSNHYATSPPAFEDLIFTVQMLP